MKNKTRIRDKLTLWYGWWFPNLLIEHTLTASGTSPSWQREKSLRGQKSLSIRNEKGVIIPQHMKWKMKLKFLNTWNKKAWKGLKSIITRNERHEKWMTIGMQRIHESMHCVVLWWCNMLYFMRDSMKDVSTCICL